MAEVPPVVRKGSDDGLQARHVCGKPCTSPLTSTSTATESPSWSNRRGDRGRRVCGAAARTSGVPLRGGDGAPAATRTLPCGGDVPAASAPPAPAAVVRLPPADPPGPHPPPAVP